MLIISQLTLSRENNKSHRAFHVKVENWQRPSLSNKDLPFPPFAPFCPAVPSWRVAGPQLTGDPVVLPALWPSFLLLALPPSWTGLSLFHPPRTQELFPHFYPRNTQSCQLLFFFPKCVSFVNLIMSNRSLFANNCRLFYDILVWRQNYMVRSILVMKSCFGKHSKIRKGQIIWHPFQFIMKLMTQHFIFEWKVLIAWNIGIQSTQCSFIKVEIIYAIQCWECWGWVA